MCDTRKEGNAVVVAVIITMLATIKATLKASDHPREHQAILLLHNLTFYDLSFKHITASYHCVDQRIFFIAVNLLSQLIDMHR